MINIILSCIKKTTQKTIQLKLNDNQTKMLELIKNNPYITIEELSKILDITVDGVEYNLRKLKYNKIIERVGADNGGYWEINKYDI